MFRETLTPFGAGKMRVELDKKALFALASDTRLDILRSLQPMRRTVTQLAESLGIDKAAVHRHLKTLEEGGLVKRYEDHGFVYYGLSWKARDLIAPNESTRVVILLSASLVLLIIAGLVPALMLASEAGDSGDYTGPAIPGSEWDQPREMSADSAALELFIMMPLVAVVFGALAMFAMAVKQMRIPYQHVSRPETEERTVSES